MTKILFINPPYMNFEGIKESGGHMLPLSFAYLSAYAGIKIPELEFEVLDCEVEGLDYRQIKERIRGSKPDIVGITAPTPPMKHVYKISEMVKEIYPDNHEWDLYNRPLDKFSDKITTNIPISLFDRIENKNSFGIMAVELYLK